MVHRPCVVGLTGGLAAGKSTVARRLAWYGVPVLDADGVVHRLYGAGEAGAAIVEDLFGPSLLAPDGAVDRAALAARVLNDVDDRRRLELAIHPVVREAVHSWLSSVGESPVTVVEAALLVETGSWREYDVLLVVWCHREQQLERAVARGMSPDRAVQLLAAQATFEKRRAVMDVDVDNSGSPDLLEHNIDVAWRKVRDLCRARRGQRSRVDTR